VRDRLNRARLERDTSRILDLVVQVRVAWDHAVEGGVYAVRDGDPPTLGRGFSDVRPTESAVFSPTRRQLRESARQAAERISEAKVALEDASRILHNGMARTDPEVLGEFLEKRQAAVQGRPARNGQVVRHG
jgi:hypothetical protein